MNVDEQFVDRIIQDTHAGKLVWKMSRGNDVYLRSPQFAIRSFEAIVEDLVLIATESSVPRYIPDHDQYFYFPVCELVVVKDGILAKTIDRETVDEGKLSWLVELVAQKVTGVDDSIANYLKNR